MLYRDGQRDVTDELDPRLRAFDGESQPCAKRLVKKSAFGGTALYPDDALGCRSLIGSVSLNTDELDARLRAFDGESPLWVALPGIADREGCRRSKFHGTHTSFLVYQ